MLFLLMSYDYNSFLSSSLHCYCDNIMVGLVQLSAVASFTDIFVRVKLFVILCNFLYFMY